MKVRCFQVHKRSSYVYDYIQDKQAVSKDSSIIALSDGTTQSFRSEVWAEVLVKSWFKNSLLSLDSFTQDVAQKALDIQNSGQSDANVTAKQLLERDKKKGGSTATFMGLKLHPDRIEIINCGDSNLFLFSNNELIKAPHTELEALDKNSSFINTVELVKNGPGSITLTSNRIGWDTGDVAVICSDALSRLFLREETSLSHLLGISDFQGFLDFIQLKWNNYQLEEDDITAIIVENSKQVIIEEFYPPKHFSFPKEEKPPFIPLSLKDQMEDSKVDETEFITKVAKRIKWVKRNKKLMFIVLFLWLLIILVTLMISNRDDKEIKQTPEPVKNSRTRESLKLPNSEINLKRSKVLDPVGVDSTKE